VADFLMPALGADMDEGTLLEWLVKPGDEIRRGDIIAVVDTAKSAIEVESFHAGTIEQLVVGVGETVPVGAVLATIAEPGAVAEGGAAPVAATALAVPPRSAALAAPAASPLVRHLARELGIDLADVTGTGPGGAITRSDLQRAAAAAAPTPAAGPSIQRPRPAVTATATAAATATARPPVTPLARRIAAELGIEVSGLTGSGPGGAVREADVRQAAARTATEAPAQGRVQAMRQAIGRLMARSKREIPHYYLSNTVDLAAAMDWLHERNRELEVADRLVPAALLLKAAALAARQVPQLNGYWQDDRFTPGDAVHLGVAISLRGGGLVTPAIHDAAELAPGELMARLRDLVSRARGGRLRRAELTEATITVTNLGDQGVESVFGVIYPPQVALVGIGKIIERPVAVGGLIGARPVVVTTLSADHRASDGYAGARYLAAMAELLQRPEDL
jgi:pyruvate dehydrogenase E2 component (dihydrolipoamide acetyltransferase)